MSTNCTVHTAVINSSCLWLYWNNWANNLRNVMESHLLFLIIMMIKIIPAVFIKNHCFFVYKILATSLQCLLLWKDISLLATIHYFFFLSLLSHFNFRADICVMENIGQLIDQDVDISHCIDLDLWNSAILTPRIPTEGLKQICSLSVRNMDVGVSKCHLHSLTITAIDPYIQRQLSSECPEDLGHLKVLSVVSFIKFLQLLYNGYCGKTSLCQQ